MLSGPEVLVLVLEYVFETLDLQMEQMELDLQQRNDGTVHLLLGKRVRLIPGRTATKLPVWLLSKPYLFFGACSILVAAEAVYCSHVSDTD